MGDINRTKGQLSVEILLNGKRHAARSWHVCPRIGEEVGVLLGGKEIVCVVTRIVHLIPNKDDDFMGRQPIDVYVTHGDATHDNT